MRHHPCSLKDEESDTIIVTMKGTQRKCLEISMERERTSSFEEVTFEKGLERWVDCHGMEGRGVIGGLLILLRLEPELQMLEGISPDFLSITR